jgi:hypothetical protein
VSAGLPGLGLGGLFFILLALLAPFVELIRTTRGRSSVAAWRAVGRQFALALTMVAAVVLTLRLLYALADATGLARTPSDRSPTALALLPIGITLGLLACVLAAAKAMQLIATIPTRGRSPVLALRALCRRPRLLGRLGALTAACSTLLLAGPPELAHAPAGRKAAATVPAPGPVARTPSEPSEIELRSAVTPAGSRTWRRSRSCRPGRASPPAPARPSRARSPQSPPGRRC